MLNKGSYLIKITPNTSFCEHVFFGLIRDEIKD